MTDYFSDRENGPRARTEQVISPRATPLKKNLLKC
jgi:hypothetical protein